MPRGRKAGFVMSDEHRVKIQNSNVLNALIEHANGKREMTASQVTAGIALMKKVLPDLQSVELKGDAENPIVHKYESLDALESRIAGIATRSGEKRANGAANGSGSNGSSH